MQSYWELKSVTGDHDTCLANTQENQPPTCSSVPTSQNFSLKVECLGIMEKRVKVENNSNMFCIQVFTIARCHQIAYLELFNTFFRHNYIYLANIIYVFIIYLQCI